MKSTPQISLVIPVFNEEGSILALAHEIKTALSPANIDWEVIFADDASTDQTSAHLESLARENPRFGFIRLARRSGQSAALGCAIGRARGHIIVSMDGDGQNDPKDIPKLLAELAKGPDVVCGWRQSRRDDFLRTWVSQIANALISKITGIRLHDHGCGLRAYKKEALDNFHIVGDMHRLLPAYLAFQGRLIKEIPVNHRARTRGRSHYHLLDRTIKVFLDAFLFKFYFSYLTRPMHFFGYASFAFLGAGALFEVIVVIRHVFFLGEWLSPLFFLGFFLMASSILFLLLGTLADIVSRGYINASKAPFFKISNEKLPSSE